MVFRINPEVQGDPFIFKLFSGNGRPLFKNKEVFKKSLDNRKVNETPGVMSGLMWKFFERLGVQGVQFMLQLVLARLLSPAHYGALSLMLIFVTIANVFIQNGFNTALIQNKNVSQEDYSSVLWISLGISGILYILLFAGIPAISRFYEMPGMATPFRVLALGLFPGALNSIQIAKVSRELDFRKIFLSNVGAVIVSGIAGILVAYRGGGVWALVIQNLLNIVISCLVMWVTVQWRPLFACNFKRVKTLFRFGWKLLISSLMDTLYQDLSSLIIGKKYDAGMNGYYNRGKQFPQFIISAVNGAVQSVMLPVMSSKQDERERVKVLTRNSIMLSSYIIFPVMAGLAGAANPLVTLLLTDKWLPCVPFLQIFCFSFAFWPVHTSNLQAINAMGRSDIYLKLEMIKKILGIAALMIAVLFFPSPIAIAMSGGINGFVSCFVNAYPNKKLIGYSYREQMSDIMPSFCASLFMFITVLLLSKITMNPVGLLGLQIGVGATAYLAMSVIFRLRPFKMLLETISTLRREKNV